MSHRQKHRHKPRHRTHTIKPANLPKPLLEASAQAPPPQPYTEVREADHEEVAVSPDPS